MTSVIMTKWGVEINESRWAAAAAARLIASVSASWNVHAEDGRFGIRPTLLISSAHVLNLIPILKV